ncbi:MAG: acyl-CoA desaturase [Chitinophagales bacterium]
MTNIQFQPSSKSQQDFYKTLQKRVNAHFQAEQTHKHANKSMLFKCGLFFTTTLALYLLFISNWFTFWQLLPIAILLGWFKALTGINIGHDAIHGAFSSSKKWNEVLGRIFDLLGVNPYTWRITHNIVHHTYTNIPEHDYDIEVSPKLLRMSPKGILLPHMRFQQYYAFVLYGFSSIFRAFSQEYVKFFSKKLGGYDCPTPPRKEYVHLFFWRFLFYTLFLAVPLMRLSLVWWQVILLFIVMMFIQGLFLGVVFQLAHIVEKVDFPAPNQEGELQHTWAVHQLKTTANFAAQNPVVNFLCGGLNTQIEHHLFPHICHIHYPNIAPIVAKTAEEFGLPYNEYPTFSSALKSHFRQLKKFGQGETKAKNEFAVS